MQDEKPEIDFRKWTKVDESYLKTNDSTNDNKSGDRTYTNNVHTSNQRSLETKRNAPKQVYSQNDQIGKKILEMEHKPKRRRQKSKGTSQSQKRVHWLLDKLSRTCYIQFWNQIEEFGMSVFLKLSISKRS